MKKLVLIMILSSIFGGCNGQKKQNEKWNALTDSKDTVMKPKTDIRVNKKFDSKGNLIHFDSTYSYSYSSPSHGKMSISGDSLFGNFKTPLKNDYKDLFDKNMNSIFFNDTLFKYDFFNDDYFSKRFELNRRLFDNMFKQMDSIKSEMFIQSYPQGRMEKKKGK